jgi:hypothetical protein
MLRGERDKLSFHSKSIETRNRMFSTVTDVIGKIKTCAY